MPDVRLLCFISLCSFLGLSHIAPIPAAAQRQDDELPGVDGSAYESPSWGYTLEWDDDTWRVDFSVSEDAVDTLKLDSDDSTLYIQGKAAYDGDPDACRDALADVLAESDGVSDWEPLENDRGDPIAGSERDRAWAAFTLTFTDDDGSERYDVNYIECRTLVEDEAVWIAIHSTAADRYEKEAELVGDIFASLELAESVKSTPQPSSDEATYESPTHGYTLTYDPGTWEVAYEDEWDDDGVDTFALSNGPSFVFLAGTEVYADDELDSCIAFYIRSLERDEGVENVAPIDGRGMEGSDDDRAWTTYSYTDTRTEGDESDWIRYWECRALGGVTLVILHNASPEDYENEVDAREDLLDGLDVTGVTAPPTDEAEAEPTEATYQSPSYGYTVTYDPGEWEVVQEDDDEQDPYDVIVLGNDSSLIILLGTPDYDEDELDTCVADYLSIVEQADEATNVESVEGSDAEGNEADRAWTTYSYGDVNDDDFEGIRYIECRALGDGLTLVVQHSAIADDYDDQATAREDLLDGLELP